MKKPHLRLIRGGVDDSKLPEWLVQLASDASSCIETMYGVRWGATTDGDMWVLAIAPVRIAFDTADSTQTGWAPIYIELDEVVDLFSPGEFGLHFSVSDKEAVVEGKYAGRPVMLEVRFEAFEDDPVGVVLHADGSFEEIEGVMDIDG